MPLETNMGGSMGQRVIVCPAMAREVFEKPVYFLFTLRQIQDIIREVEVHPVPFSPPHILGIATWRHYVVPVLSLEACLGMTPQPPSSLTRRIVVRSSGKNLLVMFNAAEGIRIIPLPLSCSAVLPPAWLSDTEWIQGVYEWQEGVLVVVDVERILADAAETGVYQENE
jgi:chemotaxis signal transduction protein